MAIAVIAGYPEDSFPIVGRLRYRSQVSAPTAAPAEQSGELAEHAIDLS